MTSPRANLEPTAPPTPPATAPNPWRLSVAPMIAWTDRHCRYFHRLLTRRTRLYTEMITTGALIHGDVAAHLRFSAEEHPLALQLGGSEPADLAHAARLGQQWGYDEINLNCGCPSERVQRGAFGACLMREPQLVADGVRAMRDAVDLPVTVKHRIGIDREDSYGFVRDFVGTVADAGCTVFIAHARNAWLQGLSPKENREIPPLRYEVVYQLKRDFPHLTIVLNGGVTDDAQLRQHLQHVDGVMVGRQAYHQPWWLASWDAAYFGATPGADEGTAAPTRESVEAAMCRYIERELAADAARQQADPAARGHRLSWPGITRHMLGLRHGLPAARRWRQVLSDQRLKDRPVAEVFALAHGGASVRPAGA